MAGPEEGAGIEGRFFDAHQRATIEAAMARIIPTDDRPGAREAGTINFLDRYLSGIDFVYAKPDGSGFEKLEGNRAEAWRQRIEILRSKYINGVKRLDHGSQSRFGADFTQLTDTQQDRVLTILEQPNLEFETTDSNRLTSEVPAEPALQQTNAEIDLDFFPLLALHTRQGFYADPIYGGNKDRIGWKSIGFEGPESMAETHAGRFSTLPFFSEHQIDWEAEKNRGV